MRSDKAGAKSLVNYFNAYDGKSETSRSLLEFFFIRAGLRHPACSASKRRQQRTRFFSARRTGLRPVQGFFKFAMNNVAVAKRSGYRGI
jgi:hypothetical protein